MRCVLYCILFAMISMLFVACGTPVKIIASNYKDSNLNNRGDDVPITLLIYHLKDGKKFEYASPKDLLNRENAVLGKDILDSARVQIPPNEMDMVIVEVNKKELRYIGILALFANPHNKNQKFYKKLHRVCKNIIKIDITQSGIMKADKKNRKQTQLSQDTEMRETIRTENNE